MKAFLKATTWVCVVIVIILALILWAPMRTAIHVAAVQNAVQRDWEISFLDSSGADYPAMLPTRIDSAAEDFIDRFLGHTHGYDGRVPAKTRNRDSVAHERFRALFRGSIEEIGVYYFEAFHGDLGAALARFPDLRRVTVEELEPDSPSEAEWTLLCTRLRQVRHLEGLTLAGAWLTDDAIAPLAGHPELRDISINFGRLTAGCTTTFSAIPQLARLHIEGQIPEGEPWLSPAEQAVMSAALPAVQIELP